MKKLMILIVLALSSVTFADPNGLSFIGRVAIANPGLYSGVNLDGMLGLKKGLHEDISGELGGIINYTDSDLGFGFYGLLHYEGEIAIPNPFKEVADWMPETIASKPFAGGGWLDTTDSFWMVGGTVLNCVEIYYKEDFNKTHINYLGFMVEIPF